MKIGKIIKGIAGFYYVHVAESGIYECKAKGGFRKQNIKPLVGDDVEMDVISEEEKTGNVVKILPRKNALIRPAVANVDQALVIFAAASPEPNLNLLDRFLIMMEQQNVQTKICFNKMDCASEASLDRLRRAYETSTYPFFFCSAGKGIGIDEIRAVLRGKTTTVAGPSGVGKSTLINLLAPEAVMETGEISEKIQRGKHTTRHSELIALADETYIFDTPGFSSLSVDYYRPGMRSGGTEELTAIDQDNLAAFYPDFMKYESECRFAGCSHTHEPSCGVKNALEHGLISASRYENYIQIYQELKNKKKY